MEVPGGHNNKFFVLVSEFLGTMFLMLAINWSSGGTTPQCVGLTVFMCAQIFGPISGAHFNPAVSLGFLFKEGSTHWVRNMAMMISMILFQGAGAFAGFGLCLGGFAFEKSSDSMKNIPKKDYYIAQLCPANGCNDDSIIAKVFVVECVCTFVFVNFVFMVVKHNGAADMPINALAIGLALFLAIRESSGISGGCINPAVGLVQSVM